MILKGSQRSGSLKLANHLLNERENDHVEIHELRGFSADDLRGALQEVDAVAKGTRCQQHLFSLSFNPPETERVNIAEFEDAIARAEARLGLSGQARAIVFHEKEGRRHAHVVWSRIDVAEMKAINLPFYKTRLNEVSKELFLDHGWRLPDGYRDKTRRDPLSFTIDQWQQAKRSGLDPKELKMIFRECWSVSDNRASFAQALKEQGFVLAQGKRGHVAVDYRGEVYAISRQTGQKAKAVREKLGDAKDLPSVDQAKDLISDRMSDKLRGFIHTVESKAHKRQQDMLQQRQQVRERQRAQRQNLRDKQQARAAREAIVRAKRFRTGMRGMWDWLSGKTRKIRQQNEAEAAEAVRRDAQEREKMTFAQLELRRVLQRDLQKTKREITRQADDLRRDVAFYVGLRARKADDDNRTRRSKQRERPHNKPELER
jgi:hypothetical protein